MKKDSGKKKILEQMHITPIVQIVCEKAGISRATYYRWRSEDETFKKEADIAIAEGEALITDMSESQLISLIRDRNFQAVQLWLKHHHPSYSTRVEITANVKNDYELTPEQKALVQEALRLAALPSLRSGDKNYE